VRAAKDKVKIGSFATLRNFNYTTRANISHEKAEQIRARIACTPAESAGIDRFAKQTRSIPDASVGSLKPPQRLERNFNCGCKNFNYHCENFNQCAKKGSRSFLSRY